MLGNSVIRRGKKMLLWSSPLSWTFSPDKSYHFCWKIAMVVPVSSFASVRNVYWRNWGQLSILMYHAWWNYSVFRIQKRLNTRKVVFNTRNYALKVIQTHNKTMDAKKCRVCFDEKHNFRSNFTIFNWNCLPQQVNIMQKVVLLQIVTLSWLNHLLVHPFMFTPLNSQYSVAKSLPKTSGGEYNCRHVIE